jgi:N-methylhydantoinase A/oxoprolinase/acetone carboxylase beta subunit
MDGMRIEDDTRLRLGLDTGGTYTDAVLFCPARGVIASAKALTTRHDLSIGISEAAGKVLVAAKADPAEIALVSMSTTLATNALVEGQGGRVALIAIGFHERDIKRDGLAEALGKDPLIFCPGGHDAHGNAAPLDLSALESALPELDQSVSGIAVAALFAVRNPAHEIAARDLIRTKTNLPVTVSHELSSKLGGPRRALTTLLNARLVGMIGRLIDATQSFLTANKITAPLMLVRGDGALVSARFALHRPIETILSGPAASLVGAGFLSGLKNAIVSDIGGTTTDVALLDNGHPRLDPDGATVGGFRTMVEAVAMRTHGLGGDSEITLEGGGLEPQLTLGPRRILPLALAAELHGDIVMEALDRQLKQENPGRSDGRFVLRTGLADRYAAGLSPAEAALYDKLTSLPQPLDRLLNSATQNAAIARLVSRGLALVCGFTPTDAQHVLGRQSNGNKDAAEKGATLFARKRDGRGRPIASGASEISERVVVQLERRSAELVLETAFAESGFEGPATVAHATIQSALDGNHGIARLNVSLDRPVIGLGASASLVYPGVGSLLSTDAIIPPHADVANAVGAVVGEVRVQVLAIITAPAEDRFRVTVGELSQEFSAENAALAFAVANAESLALGRAEEAGAEDAHVDVSTEVTDAIVEGLRKFIEAKCTAVATGRPRLGAP